jgi:hypothetical protein
MPPEASIQGVVLTAHRPSCCACNFLASSVPRCHAQPMAGDPVEELRALIEQAGATPGAAIDKEIRLVGRSLGLFTANAAHLRVQIDEEQTLESFLATANDLDERDRHLDEIDRLLHNFLAGAFTLKEHTLKVSNRLSDDALKDAYAENSPFDAPVAVIIKQLRNDTQHAHLPVIRQSVNITVQPEQSFTSRLVLPREYLRSLNLNAPTRQYVDGLSDDAALGDLVERYTLDVEKFTQWFIGAVVELWAQDLAETHVLRRRAHELAEPLRRVFEIP